MKGYHLLGKSTIRRPILQWTKCDHNGPAGRVDNCDEDSYNYSHVNDKKKQQDMLMPVVHGAMGRGQKKL